jgi:hypothetical protein
MFNQRRAGLNPVSAIVIVDIIHPADFGVVYVTAHHALITTLVAFVRQRLLEVADKADSTLNPMFEKGR